MGVNLTKQHDLLEGSEWLRAVVTHHQQKNKNGVNGFESFTIEPVFHIKEEEERGLLLFKQACARHDQTASDDESTKILGGSVKQRRVTVAFKNGKDQKQEVHWIVKSAHCDTEDKSVFVLNHEVKVHMTLLGEINKFLMEQDSMRAKFLLNLPEFIFQERKCHNGILQRCHLVLEDVARTKNCSPVTMALMEGGLPVNYFKVFLGTLAQIHAVCLAYNLSLRDKDSLLNSYPYLQRNSNMSLQSVDVKEMNRAFVMYEKLLKWQQRKFKYSSSSNISDEDFSRRLKLVSLLKASHDELLMADKASKYDPLKSICIGPVMPNEIMFQHDRLMFHHPICAAVTTCQRVHYGHIIKELSLAFYVSASPDVRTKDLVPCLQTYCQVLTSTLEILEVDWIRQFRMTFPQFVHNFQKNVAQAVFKAIILHMRTTDSKELDRVVHSNKEAGAGRLVRKIFVPLTKKRVDFLVKLTDLVQETIQ